ncbi:MAG: MlaA family lipoprotein [Rhodospirillaceae bacterium]
MSFRNLLLAFSAMIPLLTTLPSIAVAQAPASAKSNMATPNDVLEPLNRTMFAVNNGVVSLIVDPTARVLGAITPDFVRQIGANMYENVSEPEFVFTNLLAGYNSDAAVSVGRFVVNSTVGIAGMFDPASALGLQRRTTEVSEAMCKAGIPPGPYLVFPLVGPSNLFSGGILGVVLAAEWYALSMVSTMLAAADAIFDISVSVASLRHVRDIPEDGNRDRYTVQQKEFWDYVKAGCGAGGSVKAALPAGATAL